MSTISASQQPPVDQSDPEVPPLQLRPVLGIAIAFVVLELALAARYGFHRDELYFLACARHLAWGYVDQPPLVPAIAWVITHVIGSSVVALRVLPALAGGSTVVLSAAMARELGGGRRAQVLAALAAATSPQVLAAFHLLSTTAFDLLAWAAVCFVTLRILRTGDRHWWLVVGAIAGVGLLNKLNVAFLLFGIAVGLVCTGRSRMLADRWVAAGTCIAFVLWSPNIWWNATHDWAALSMLHSLHQENGGVGAVAGFIPSQLVVVGPVLVLFWLAGLRHLLRTPTGRPLGAAYLVLLVVFTFGGAKPYYLAGMYFVLFAAGGVWAESRLVQRRPPQGIRGWVVLMLVGGIAALPLVLPVLPQGDLAKGPWEGRINKDLSATVGWQPFVGQIARVSRSLPPDERKNLVVFTGDYGAAGAIDLWGSEVGLPTATSGHNSYWWWGPPRGHDDATTIAVNLSRSFLLTIFADVRPAGTVTTPGGVWSEERDDPIWICTRQRSTWRHTWADARHYG